MERQKISSLSWILHTFFAILFSCLSMFTSFALDVPKFSPEMGYVLDQSNILDQGTKQQINNFASEIEKKTKAQIVVFVIPSLEGEAEADYALKALRTWEIGDAKENTGAVILLAMKEKRIRVEVGYGLEGILNDAKIGELIDNTALPYFRKSDYGSGIKSLLMALGTEIAKERQVALSFSQPDSAHKNKGLLTQSSKGEEWSIWEVLLAVLGAGLFLFVDIKFFGGQLTMTLIWAFFRGGSGGSSSSGGRGSGGGSGGGGGAGRGW